MFFDPVYLIIVMLPSLILAGGAALVVKSRFAKYSKIPAQRGMSGAEVAREILRRNGLNGVPVEPHEGFLSDHYDPTKRVVRLSPKVYHGRSVASVAVAAHEVGHALQHAQAYGPLVLRHASVPMANVGSNLSVILIMIGLFAHALSLAWVGVFLFGFVVLFQLVTVPVEFNASSRAKAQLMELGLVTVSEHKGVAKVLSAAALTYVAALVVAMIQLLYFIMAVTGARRD